MRYIVGLFFSIVIGLLSIFAFTSGSADAEMKHWYPQYQPKDSRSGRFVRSWPTYSLGYWLSQDIK